MDRETFLDGNTIVPSFSDSLFHEGQFVRFREGVPRSRSKRDTYLVVGYHNQVFPGGYLLFLELIDPLEESPHYLFWIREIDLEFAES